MILTFLGKSATFDGVRYNTDKMELGKGELILVRNFGALQGLSGLRPQDYINYLMARSAQSKRIVYPQLHVALSCKKDEYTKDELAVIAGKWLKEMGYGENPYLLVFHRDTANNHLHMVSTRVGKDGKKIKDSYEHLVGYRVLHRIMGMDTSLDTKQDIAEALTYRFSTRAQFAMLLETKGYTLHVKEDSYQVSKFGTHNAIVPLAEVDARIAQWERDTRRTGQLKAIFGKYAGELDRSLHPVGQPFPGGRKGNITGYRSELTETLREKFGLHIVFHYSGDKTPYGYTLIDHSSKAVFKGSQIMPLREFAGDIVNPLPHPDHDVPVGNSGSERSHPLNETDPVPAIVPMADTDVLTAGFEQDALENDRTDLYMPEENPTELPDLHISNDIDDEAILGRNRRRKRKARTNTR